MPQMVQKLEMMTMKRRVISLSMVSLKDKFYTCISMILHRFIFRSFGFVSFFSICASIQNFYWRCSAMAA